MTGYIYAFKYAEVQCEIDGTPFVLCKLGKAVGWSTLMARFKNHQRSIERTMGICPLLPRHGQNGSGEAPLYGKTFAESGGTTIYMGGLEDVIEAMSDEEVDLRYRRDHADHEARVVWPDLAYVIPMTEDLARTVEAVMQWNLCTYVNSSELKERLDQLHQWRHPGTRSTVSHEETSLMPLSTFQRLRELFLTGTMDSNMMTHLVVGRRIAPSSETAPATLRWTNRDGNHRSMLLHYYLPAHHPGKPGDEGMGLLLEHDND